MTQELYQKAAKFAAEKHAEQKIPSSKANYMLHLSNVAMEILVAHSKIANFKLDLAIQMALLHDTLEDTETSAKELKELFGNEVALGVEALTKKDTFPTKAERMQDSLVRLQTASSEARLVKIADRITNLQEPPKHWEKDKIEKYGIQAQTIYDMLHGEHEYLDNRLLAKIEEYKRYV